MTACPTEGGIMAAKKTPAENRKDFQKYVPLEVIKDKT